MVEKYTERGQDIQKELVWRETRSTIWPTIGHEWNKQWILLQIIKVIGTPFYALTSHVWSYSSKQSKTIKILLK